MRNIDDKFWNRYIELLNTTILPYQYEALNDRVEGAEPSYSIRNFKVAAGLIEFPYGGREFQDSDVAKWIEAVGHSLVQSPNKDLENKVDEIVEFIEKAQHEDGYLNTYFTVKEPGKRWTNLYDCHELYCLGHMIEGAVSYYKATGKDKLLKIVCRAVDYVDQIFGWEEGKIQGCDGHQEIELALLKLYSVTKNKKYLDLCKFFLDVRGTNNFFYQEWEKRGKKLHENSFYKEPNLKYIQSHKPIRDQKTAEGHAVRAVYMYSAMAELSDEIDDMELKEVCNELWQNIVNKQMYITGAIGSTEIGESFTYDYDLPNDTIYGETCASVGLIFFAKRMFKLNQNSEYYNTIEKILYNLIIGSMSLDGKKYFYVNPLEADPISSENNPLKKHVKITRQPWFGCSCCPPNVARLLANLNDYIYDVVDNNIYSQLFIGSQVLLEVKNSKILIEQQSEVPWDGKVEYLLKLENDENIRFNIRVPEWIIGDPLVKINEKIVKYEIIEGYIVLEKKWSNLDKIQVEFRMDILFIESNQKITKNSGKISLQRGPIIYCLEERDNFKLLSSIFLDSKTKFSLVESNDIVSGAKYITGNAKVKKTNSTKLYFRSEDNYEDIKLKAIPYFMWANRGANEMTVWINKK